jgi:hypothetical protein
MSGLKAREPKLSVGRATAKFLKVHLVFRLVTLVSGRPALVLLRGHEKSENYLIIV